MKASSCWNDAVAEAKACVPATTGAFASDNQTCTFDDGTVARFDKPLSFPIDISAANNPSVTIMKGAAQCAKLVQTPGTATLTLTTQSGPYQVVTTLSGVTLTCGDGKTMATKWSDCTTAPREYDTTGQPAVTYGGNDNQFSVGFEGYFVFDGGFSSLDSWFSCKKP